VKRRSISFVALVSLLCILALSSAVSAQTPGNLICVPHALAPADGCLESDYDRFENKATVKVEMRVLGAEKGERVFLAVLGQFTDAASKPPALVTFSVTGFGVEDYLFPASDCVLNVIADNQRFRVEMAKTGQEQVAAYSYGQGFGGHLGFSDFKKLTEATDVEMRFCGSEFKLTSAQLVRLRAFVERIGK